GAGIALTNSASINIYGNRIGTNALGTAAIPNVSHGISISSSNTSNIGTAGGGNVISGNGADGISLFGSSTGNVLVANYIGTSEAGTGVVSNSSGVSISSSGTIVGPGNVISGNIN